MIRNISWAFMVVLAMKGACMGQSAPTVPPSGYMYPVQPSTAGKHVWVVGQRPYDKQGKLIGKGNLDTQLKQVFANIKASLASVNSTLSDIKQITYHIRQLDNTKEAIVSEARNLYLPKQSDMISEIKSVGKVINDDVLVEIEVVAVTP